jgi:protein YibB
MITIVSAFFDIGRGTWTPSMVQRGGNIPHYLFRTNETYIERFAYLLKLENDIVLYTSEDIEPKIRAMADEIGKKNFSIVVVDFKSTFSTLRSQVRAVMDDPTFPAKINPNQIRNPEYWCEDYVVVTFLKAHFVADAIEQDLVDTEQVAWIDFGYCRDEAALGGKTKWDYDFDPSRIHMFNCIPVDPSSEKVIEQVSNAVCNNVVYILGAAVVAAKSYWRPLANAMQMSIEMLMENGLVDDDQGNFLVCMLGNPDAFELHPIDYNDPFIVFRYFNK